ncbi:MAG: hypothetical protein ACR2PR_09585 [Pseudohongiellaceae bacterium]
MNQLHNHLLATCLCLLAMVNTAFAAEAEEESLLKFTIYSSAWGEKTDDGLRIVAHNQSAHPILLHSITLLPASTNEQSVTLNLELPVPAMNYANTEIPYTELLKNDECITRTMTENWRLAEISNYTLNPSVRNLIIEDTDSFRIYQCTRTVRTTLTNTRTGERSSYEEWILFHFETQGE